MGNKFYHLNNVQNKECFNKCPNKLIVDPAFRLMRSPFDGELDFYFEKLIFI